MNQVLALNHVCKPYGSNLLAAAAPALVPGRLIGAQG